MGGSFRVGVYPPTTLEVLPDSLRRYPPTPGTEVRPYLPPVVAFPHDSRMCSRAPHLPPLVHATPPRRACPPAPSLAPPPRRTCAPARRTHCAHCASTAHMPSRPIAHGAASYSALTGFQKGRSHPRPPPVRQPSAHLPSAHLPSVRRPSARRRASAHRRASAPARGPPAHRSTRRRAHTRLLRSRRRRHTCGGR